MPPLGSAALLLSNSVLAKWLLEDFPFRIQLAQIFPFLPVAGDALRYASTDALQPGVTVGNGDAIPENTDQANDPNRVYRFAEIATHFRVRYAAQDTLSSNVNDQVAVQSALAVRKLLYRFWTLFESGNATLNPRDFNGLNALVDSTNVIERRGAALTLEDLDRAKEMVRSNDGRGVVIFTSSLGKRAIHAAHWVRGLTPQYEVHEFKGPDGDPIEHKVLVFDGAPVFVNDLNQTFSVDDGPSFTPLGPLEALRVDGVSPAATTHIWFFVLGEGNLHGIVPENARDIIVRSTLQEGGSALVYHYTMPSGIALGSAAALSGIRDIAIPRFDTKPAASP